MTELEEVRANELPVAQTKAENLFREIDERGLIHPRISENELNDDIYALANEM